MASLLPDYSTEEMAVLLARHKKKFTIEKLIEYVEDDVETFPAEGMLAELDEMVRLVQSSVTSVSP
ncbi:MAG TPA: hypothetical protein VGJ05_14755 [Fimbriiglobus sp.]|jgi:hypothetical protein